MTLWSTLSLFVHVTFWPTLAVASFGENAMFFMSMFTPEPAAVGCAAGVEFELGLDELPQPAAAIEAVRARSGRRRFMRSNLASAYFVTVIVACMPGWKVQTYVIMPGLSSL